MNAPRDVSYEEGLLPMLKDPEEAAAYIEDVNTWLASPPVKAPYRISLFPLLDTVPHKSPRDSKPWETLVPFYKPITGLYMYQQAVREIADAEGWKDVALEELDADMRKAINDKKLPVRNRHTGIECALNESASFHWWVTVDDVNEWLKSKRVPYRWALQANAPAPVVEDSAVTEKDDLPVFRVEARPFCVPPELENMSAADYVRYVDDVGAGLSAGFAFPNAPQPAPLVTSSKNTIKRRTWRDVALPYVVDIFKAGNFTTAKALYSAVESKAGKDSPFERGTDANRGKLVVRELSKTVSLKTIQNKWSAIKAQK
jgi:hypothetical protein